MSARTQGVSGFAPAQLTFSFIPPEDRQKTTDLWTTHFSRAEVRARRSIEAGRKKILLKVIDSKTLAVDWEKHRSLLELPLWRHEATDLDVQPAVDDAVEPSGPDVVSGTSSGEDGQVVVTDEVVAIYHEKVLEYSLKVLNSKGNAEEKFEILQWIWAPDIYCWVTRHDAGVIKKTPIYRRQLPFTFQMCCACSGLDAERMREGLAHVLRPVLKGLGMESYIN